MWSFHSKSPSLWQRGTLITLWGFRLISNFLIGFKSVLPGFEQWRGEREQHTGPMTCNDAVACRPPVWSSSKKYPSTSPATINILFYLLADSLNYIWETAQRVWTKCVPVLVIVFLPATLENILRGHAVQSLQFRVEGTEAWGLQGLTRMAWEVSGRIGNQEPPGCHARAHSPIGRWRWTQGFVIWLLMLRMNIMDKVLHISEPQFLIGAKWESKQQLSLCGLTVSGSLWDSLTKEEVIIPCGFCQ